MKASILIPAYRRKSYLPLSIESALAQDMPESEYEVIVISDGDPEMGAIAKRYGRVRYIEHNTNRGQSAAVNTGIAESTGEYIAIQHDDDLSYSRRLSALCAALDADPMAGIACGLSDLVDASGNNHERNQSRIDRYRERGQAGPSLINQAWYSCVDGQASLYRRTMLSALGGYDETMIHAEEVDIHIRAAMTGWRILFVDELLAAYRVHGGNKSMVEGRPMHMRESTVNVGAKLRSGFRPSITINISSKNEREAGLKASVAALLPQCDRLNVNLYMYPVIPAYLDNPKIRVVQSTIGVDRGSSEKFRFAQDTKGYYITCDDDILYPKDYIEQLVWGIERHGRKAICGFHGARILESPVKNYYDARQVFHYREALAEDTPVDVIGNVCGGFHTDALPVSMSDFAGPHMQDDIYLCAKAQRLGVPRVCLAHAADWIQDNPEIDQASSIYNRYRNGCPEIAETLNAAFAKQVAA